MSPLGLMLAEYSGVDLTATTEAQGGENAPMTGSNAMLIGPLTMSADSVVISFFADSSGHGSMMPGAGWTPRAWDSGFYSMLEDNAPTGAPAGTIEPDAALPTSVNDMCWVGVAAAFRML